jgi:protease-4
MGNAAASGGYYLASAANAIVAQPATLTGSIGVFMLRASVAGLYDKLEINTEIFERGPFSTMAASAVPFTEEQKARTQEFVHIKYDEFLDRVATGRQIDREEVDRLGRGQVWLGDAAFGHGLVDAMGGLHTAVERAAQEAGIADEADPVRQVFPGPRSLGEQLREMLSSQIDLGLNLGFVPDELRALLESGLDLTDGEIAYLPLYWIEIK